MNNIRLQAVPQNAMRPPYDQPGAGDWFYSENGDLVIKVAGPTFDDPETFLVALHEMVEAYLCRKRGISQAAVDRFDAAHDSTLDHLPDSEPGDHPACPYRTEHRAACLIEHLMASFLGIADYGNVS